MIPVEEALARLLADAEPVRRVEWLDLSDACRRVLASDITALRTQPAFDASAMDGYALRAADAVAGAGLPVVGLSAAGHAHAGSVEPGTAVRIFTGAPVPAGADAILIQENADVLQGGSIRVLENAVAGRHIRPAGADFRQDDVLVRAGTRLRAGALSLAASGGHPRLPVLGRPTVAVLATGDELVQPGEALGPAQIVASNTFGVAAIAQGAGGRPLDYGIARDTEAAIGAAFDRAVREGVDVFVTIGGASVGDHDLVGQVFRTRGVALDFWKVAMRPGKPLMAGRFGPMRVLGLPGNPASSLVTATLFLRPLVAALAGNADRSLYRNGVLGADLPGNDMRADFLRATIEDDAAVTPILNPLGRQDSSLLSVFARADVLLERPMHAPAARRGDPCRFIPLDD